MGSRVRGRVVQFANLPIKLLMPKTFTNIHEIALKTIPSASKIEIKRVLESLYGFEVEKVQTLNMEGKKKKRGGVLIAKPDYKKAYVTLKNPLSISPDLYPIRIIEEDKKRLNKQTKSSVVEEETHASTHWLDDRKEAQQPFRAQQNGRFGRRHESADHAKFPWSSMSIISSCLESKSNAIIDHVLRDCDLVGRFLQADKNSILSAESNQVYLQRLMALENKPLFQHVAVRCICSLLDANPHFNYRESLLDATVRNISSTNDAIRKLCCSTIKSLFTNEGKHGGEVTLEAVRLIADHVKAHNCQFHPDSVDVFLSLSFNEDLLKYEKKEEDQKLKNKNSKKRKNMEASNQLVENDRKRSRQESISKTREEVEADYKAASFAPDVMERRQMQTATLSVVFETYFRILKHTMQSIRVRPEANAGALSTAVEPLPLLAPCLKGLAKFSHLIDLDFMGDLMNHLKALASGSSYSGNTSDKCSKCLTVSERLQCCIVAFKVMRNNLDALNVDLQDFFIHLYNLVLEYNPGRDQGEVLAEALKIMLCDDKQHDMQKTAAFIKRLATISLCVGSADSMAALVTVKNLLQKNVKCRNLLENDIGGGSVSGTIPKYLPYSTDPNLSGALASVLWELNLLSSHYHPAISTLASGISSMSTAHNQVLLSKTSPQLAYKEMSLDQELCFTQQSGSIKLNNKRKRTNGPATSPSIGSTTVMSSFDDNELQRKLISHFMVHHDIKENERLRKELDRTALSLQLYEQYKKQKKQKKRS